MLTRPAVLALALLLAAAPARGQTPGDVRPGGVVTVIAADTARPGDTLHYTLETVEGVRLFGSRSGVVVADAGRTVRVPFTVGLPANAGAGPFRVGTWVAEDGQGRVRRREIRVDVAALWDVELRLGRDTATAAPGEPVEVEYRIWNRGNASDTFDVSVTPPPGWVAHALPDRVPLPAGTTATGTVRLVPAETALRGAEHRVRVRIAGNEVTGTEFLTVLVVSREAWLGGLAQVPASLFVGSSSNRASEPSVALRASGEVGSGTRMSLALRHSASLVPPTSFRSELAGPRLRLDLESDGWKAAAGDIYMTGDVFSGPFQQGRGGQLEITHGAARGEALVATPWSYGPRTQSGHLVQMKGEIATSAGRFGLQLSSVDHQAGLLGFRSIGAGLTYGARSRTQRLSVAAGLSRVGSGGASRTGLAASARYQLEWDGGIVTSLVRTVPGTTRRATNHDREAFVSALVDVSPGLALTGWGFIRSAPMVDGSPHPASRGLAGGVQIDLPLNARADLTAGARRADQVGDTLPAEVVRSGQARLNVPIGSARMEAGLEVGTVNGLWDRNFHNLRLGVRWLDATQWAWVGITRYDYGIMNPEVRAEIAGAVEVRTAKIQAGANFPLGEALGRHLTLWSGVEVPLNQDYDVLAGLDYSGARAEPTRVSLGVRRRIGLPLPVRRSPAVQGVVFEDRNGNRVQDGGEPVLAGVEVRLGALRTTTDSDGRFQFFDAGPGPLRILPSALPSGTMVPAGAYLPSSGNVQIPVIRTATLELELFLDRDGDGAMDDAEAVADGAAVTLIGPRGRSRDGTADQAGRIRFSALEAGDYTVRILRPGGTRPFESRLTLSPGARVTRTLAVPAWGREIRLQNGRLQEEAGAGGLRMKPSLAHRTWSPEVCIVLFDFDSDVLGPEALALLREPSDLLGRDSSLTIVLHGHADTTGPDDYNLALSQRRARAVARFFQAQGIPPSRIRMYGFGESRPAATNHTREGRARNRRVEVLVQVAATGRPL